MEFFNELWATAKQAGPFASLLLLVALYVVNEERKVCLSKSEAKMDALLERVFVAMHDASDSIKDVRELILRLLGGKQP
jgi:hypothetical protein